MPASPSRPAAVALSLLVAMLVAGAAIASMLAGKSAMLALLALPVALTVGLLLALRPEALLLSILAVRAAIDPVLETLKQDGGASPGAAVNAMVLMLFVVFLLRRPAPMINIRVLAWVPFLALAFAAMRVAPESAQPLRMLLIYMTYLAVFAIPFGLVSRGSDIGRLVGTVIVASIVPTISGLVQVARGGLPEPEADAGLAGDSIAAPVDYSGFRIEAVFNHPNIFGCFLVTVIAALLYAISTARASGRPGYRRMLEVYLLVQIGLLLATQTRSAWAAAGLLFIAVGLFLERRYLVYMAVALPLLLLVPVVQDRVVDAVMGTRASYGADDQLTSYAWRLMMWQAAAEWIAQRPLLGWGLNAYTEYSGFFFPYDPTHAYDAHNVFVQLAFETGIPGAAAFAGIFLVGMLATWKRWRVHRAETVVASALTLAFMMTCYSDNVHHYLVANWYTLFLLGTLHARMTRVADPNARGGVHA
ncbi:MAG: O-antigen ligase family protein [Burkholderiaceae bacterium]|nr:O-antigen ligase family protein [Burkholderiaceae bacterium]